MRTRGLVALAVAFVAAGACGSGPSPAPSASVRARVEYQISGRAPSVTVVYGNRHHHKKATVVLPWTHVGSAFDGTTVVLSAAQASSTHGYRIVCVLSVTIPGDEPLVSRDSSHIVGIKAEGGSQNVLYDGQCNTEARIPATGG